MQHSKTVGGKLAVNKVNGAGDDGDVSHEYEEFYASNQSFYMRNRGRFAILAGVCWNIFQASAASIGSSGPYVLSRFEDSDKGIASSIFQTFLLFMVFGNFLNAKMVKKEVHVKKILLISYSLVMLAFLLSATVDNFNFYIASFPLLFGFGNGLSVMMSNYVLSLYYPNERALMYGILSASYGFGAGVWVLFNTWLNNPDFVEPTDTDMFPTKKPFDKDVSKNFPRA